MIPVRFDRKCGGIEKKRVSTSGSRGVSAWRNNIETDPVLNLLVIIREVSTIMGRPFPLAGFSLSAISVQIGPRSKVKHTTQTNI